MMPARPLIAVTGANGFVGSWLCGYLSQQGLNVHGFVRETSDVARLRGIDITLSKGNERELLQKLTFLKPDVVILADWNGVSGESRNSPDQAENIHRWLRIVQTCRSLGTPQIVAFGSQAELGHSQENCNENSQVSPENSYARAKCQAQMELVAELQGSLTHLTWVRVFSIYGPGDNANWLIPTLIRSIRNGEKIDLTPCTHKWNYLHVYDLVRLIYIVLQSSKKVPTLHAASPSSLILKDYITFLAELLDGECYLNFGAIPYSPDMISGLSPDVGLAQSLGWSPKLDWPNGVKHLLSIQEDKFNEIAPLIQQFEKY